MTQDTSQSGARLAEGTSVLDVKGDAEGHAWLVTSVGILQLSGGEWLPPSGGQPLVPVNALVCAGKVMAAGGNQGQLAYSADGGSTWYLARVTVVVEAITCLVASPAFARDGVLLAGTAGAGILRSADGGRSWHTSNFGLSDFSVLALAASPVWERQEIVFAATERGLYRSPNGGRAWKRCDSGLADTVVQTIALGPSFAADGAMLVGTESAGVFRSRDAGRTWHAANQGLPPPDEMPPINALWFSPDPASRSLCLLGTGDGTIWRSSEDGDKWNCVHTGQAPVLCLAQVGHRLCAGLHGHGMAVSDDGGQTWTTDE